MGGLRPTPVLLTGALAAVAASGSIEVNPGDFNVAVWGTFTGTVQVERSFDNGTTWIALARDGTGAVASFTAPATLVGTEPERGCLYRFSCTAFTSGSINYRLSQ
jgi:hypothetical protein